VKKKVCHITHGLVGSGVETVIFNYGSQMMDEFQFDVLYQYDPNPDVLSKFQNAGFNCIKVPSKVQHPLKHIWTVYKIFKKNQYEIVHSHLDYFMNSYVCFLAMLAGIKKRVAHHHQAYELFRNGPFMILLRKIICAFMRILCKLFATDWVACGKSAAKNGWGQRAVDEGKVTILPNAVDPELFKFNEFDRQEIRKKYGIAEDDYVVGHVGRFYPQKNHVFLIDVFFELHKRSSNAKLLLLGDGPLQEPIKQKICSLGLNDSVVFAGIHNNPVPFYSAMDVFCLPSLWEGLPMTLVEAQYNGLPCVISDSVTNEANMSRNVVNLPLDNNLWLDEIQHTRRMCEQTCCKNCMYDINEQKYRLRKIYLTEPKAFFR
jgi:glycosyltransferase EpsF